MDNALKVHEKFLKKQEQQLQKFSERRDAMLEKMNEIDQAIRDLSQEQNTANNTLQAEFDAEYLACTESMGGDGGIAQPATAVQHLVTLAHRLLSHGRGTGEGVCSLGNMHLDAANF